MARSQVEEIKLELSPEQLSELVSLLPKVLKWIRDTTDPRSFCPLLVSAAQETQYGGHSLLVGFALQSLWDIKGLDNIQDEEMDKIFDTYDNKVWIGSVLKVFTAASRPIIPLEVKQILLDTPINTNKDIRDISEILQKDLDFVPHAVLGEFCALVNRTWKLKGSNPKKVAEVLGPFFLLHETVTERRDFSAAQTVFRTIVQHSDDMFDVGESTTDAGTQLPPGFNRAGNFHAAQHLRLFFELRDRKYLPIVDQLFQYHGFVDIARGIYSKYFMLPEGWKDELVSKKASGVEMDWFNPRKVYFMSEDTIKYPSASKLPFYYPLKSEHEEVSENVVDEILSSEKEYFESLKTFKTTYVSEIQAIAKGSIGREAKDALGLTESQVEYIFGKRLKDVIDLVDNILVNLEVLIIVREKIPAIYNIGRAGVLSDVMVSMTGAMKTAYLPYNKYYSQSDGMLNAAQDALDQSQGGTSGVASSTRSGTSRRLTEFKKNLNFIELWNEISQSKSSLRGQRIQSILIKPAHRFPKYKLFFERLLKKIGDEVGEEHPTFVKVNNAHDALVDLTHQINADIERYQEIQRRRFGEVVQGGEL